MDQRKLIYGCMGLGGSWDKSPITAADQIKADNVIETALELGITHFDHADIYTSGKAEQVFGDFLKNRPSVRENLFIQSKTGIQLHAGPLNSSRYNLSDTYIISQVDGILSRLNAEYLDALLLHRPDPLSSMEEIANTLLKLKKNGKVKSYGVSNMSVSQIQLLQSYLDEPIFTNQIRLSLAHSILFDLEVWVNRYESPKTAGLDQLLAYSAQHKMSIQAYSPLAQGKYATNSEKTGTEKQTAKLLNELAEKYKTSPTAILLAWLWKIPALIHPIIGTTNIDRIKASVEALKIDLSREDWYDLWIISKGTALP